MTSGDQTTPSAVAIDGRRVAIPELARAPVLPAGRIHRMTGETMGTTWAVSLAASTAAGLDALRRDIELVLDTVVSQMSTWREDSDLSRFNNGAAGSTHTLPEPFLTVLLQALAVADDTGGAYDPTVAPAVDLWGFGPSPTRTDPPDGDAIEHVRTRVDWSALAVDVATRTIRQPGGVAIDLSAIAKGYAVDAVAACLEAHGFSSFLVDIGGELRGAGIKPDGQPWWVSLERPVPGTTCDVPAETLLVLCDTSVATSGNYRRYFDHDGRRYAHTIDPRTARPVTHDVASVTVVHNACVTADAISTALTVLGVGQGLRFCDARGIAALFISRTPAGFDEHMSAAFAALLS